MNAVLFQGFHWFLSANFPDSKGRNLWQFLHDEAGHYRTIGIDAIWLPPVSMADAENSVGYDVYDHFNAGEFRIKNRPGANTKYGSKSELLEAIKALHGDETNKRIQVYADIVLNHLAGGYVDDVFWEAIRVETHDRHIERWGDGFEQGKIAVKGYTKFDYTERANTYSSFKWNVRHFDNIDTAFEIQQDNAVFKEQGGKYIYRFLYNEEGYTPHVKNVEKWVSLEKGNYDHLTSCDFDYGRHDVREEMKYWGEWLMTSFDFDGVRLDAVKHISAGYIREWLGHVRWKTGKELFAVAEYIDTNLHCLHQYIEEVTTRGEYPQRVCLFDFPLYFKFRDVSQQGEQYNIRNLFTGTLMAEQPALAVTFVENHDYEYGRAFRSHVEEWFKPLAYAFILLREQGMPCVFFPDYYGSVNEGGHKAYTPGRQYLELLLKLRKKFAWGAENWYCEESIAGWVRLGLIPDAGSVMAVVINTGFDKVQGIWMNTSKANAAFYHLVTIKWTENGFLIVKGAYERYGNKAEGLWTDDNGWASFVADGGTVSIWLEEGATLD